MKRKTSSEFNAPDDYVFPTRRGTQRDRNMVRTRILCPAIKRANVLLDNAGRPLIDPNLTFHSLRRTYASLLADAGADAAYTKAQIGHKSARLTLEVYTDVGNRRHGANEHVGTLLRGLEAAHNGTNPLIDAHADPDALVPSNAEPQHLQD